MSFREVAFVLSLVMTLYSNVRLFALEIEDTSQAALTLTNSPVPAGTDVIVVVDQKKLRGRTVRSPALGWLGIKTRNGLVYIPYTSIDELWPTKVGQKEAAPKLEPIPDTQMLSRRGFSLDENLESAAGHSSTAQNIYEELWELDQKNNGLSVGVRGSKTEENNLNAEILLDEQNTHRGGGDRAPKPLFHRVESPKLMGPTYQSVKKLFDNYVAKNGEREDEVGMSPVEDAEIEEFLSAVMQSEVMIRCKNYIETKIIRKTLTDREFKDAVRKHWFELYDNYRDGSRCLSRNPKKYANGFEHVFIGDYSGQEIGGHHFWYKYWLDEKAGKAGTRGHNYAPNSGGEHYPWVATFRMHWTIDGDEKESDKKGFLVGNSPELLIAWGTLNVFEREAGLRSSDDKRLTIANGCLTLRTYLETINENCDRGDQIKSMFPMFEGLNDPTCNRSDTEIDPDRTDQSGPVVIARAMINPRGREAGKEWVEIKNTGTEDINIEGWTLCDRRNRCQEIHGVLKAGQTTRIPCTRQKASHPQLSNSRGIIALKNRDRKTVSRVSYTKTRNGLVTEFLD